MCWPPKCPEKLYSLIIYSHLLLRKMDFSSSTKVLRYCYCFSLVWHIQYVSIHIPDHSSKSCMIDNGSFFVFHWGGEQHPPIINVVVCVLAVADPRGAPPTDQNFLNFMQFLGKIWQICMLEPTPGGMAPPPTGNPGSAPGLFSYVWFPTRGIEGSRYIVILNRQIYQIVS